MAQLRVFRGKHLLDEELNDEQVIPKSLGGGRSTVIRVGAGAELKACDRDRVNIANDQIVVFGRQDTDAHGHRGLCAVLMRELYP